MADLERSIKVLLMGEDVNLQRSLKNMDRDFDRFTRNVQDAAGPLADFGRKAAMAEAALVAMTGAGIVYSLNKAKDLQSAMIDLEKVVGDQPDLLDEAKRSAYELGDTYGESTSSIIQSIADFKQAGFGVQESVQLVKNSLDLMIAGEIEAAQSSEYLVRILKGFDEGADQAGRAVDILNEISNEYATDVQKLAEGMSRLAPIADTVGISMEQTAGLITPIIEVFQSGSEAARALRTGMLRLADPTPKVKDALEDLGVATEDASGAQRNAYDILLDVAGAYEGLSEEQRLTNASVIAGKEQAARLVKVFNNLEGVLGVTETAMGAAGSATEEVNKRLESAEVAINRFFTAVDNTFAKAGEQYLDSATGMIDASTEVAQAIQQSIDDGTFDPILNAIDNFFRSAESQLQDIARFLPEALEQVEFDGLIDSFRDLGDQAADAIESILGGDIDLSTIDGLRDALQRLVNLFEGLTRFTTGFIEGLDPMLRVIGEIGQQAGAAGDRAQELLGNISGLAETARTGASALDGMKTAVWALAGAIGVSGSSGGLAGLLDGLAAAATRAMGAAGTAGAGAGVLGLAVAFDTAYDKALQFFGIEWRGILDSFDGLGDAVRNIFDALPDALGSVWSDVESDSKSAASTLEDSFYGAVGGVTKEFQKLNDEWYGTMEFMDHNPPSLESTVSAIEKVQGQFKEQGLEADWDAIKKNIEENPIKPDLLPIPTDDIKTLETMDPVSLPVELRKKNIERDIAEIEAAANSLQNTVEWEAKLDIEQVKAAAEVTKTAFEEAGDTIESTQKAVSALVSEWGDAKFGTSQYMKIQEMIEERFDMEKEAFEMQKKMNQAQLDLMNLRKEKLEQGDALLKIDTTGVEPAIEMVLWNILEKAQVRMNENVEDYLLGTG